MADETGEGETVPVLSLRMLRQVIAGFGLVLLLVVVAFGIVVVLYQRNDQTQRDAMCDAIKGSVKIQGEELGKRFGVEPDDPAVLEYVERIHARLGPDCTGA